MTVDEPEILDVEVPGADRIPSFARVETTRSRRPRWVGALALAVVGVVAFLLTTRGGETVEAPVAEVADQPATEADAEPPLDVTAAATELRRRASGVAEWYRLESPEGIEIRNVVSTDAGDLLVLVKGTGGPTDFGLLSTSDGDTWSGDDVRHPEPQPSRQFSVTIHAGGLLIARTETDVYASTDRGTSWTDLDPETDGAPARLSSQEGARVGDIGLVVDTDTDGLGSVLIEDGVVTEAELPPDVATIGSTGERFVALSFSGPQGASIWTSADGVAWDEEALNGVAFVADDGTVTIQGGAFGVESSTYVPGRTTAEQAVTFVGNLVAPPVTSGDRVVQIGGPVELTDEELEALRQPIVVPDTDGLDAQLSVDIGPGVWTFDGTGEGLGIREVDPDGDTGVRFSDADGDSFVEILDDDGEPIARFAASDFEAVFEEQFDQDLLDRAFAGADPQLRWSDDGGATWSQTEMSRIDPTRDAFTNRSIATVDDATIILRPGLTLIRPGSAG